MNDNGRRWWTLPRTIYIFDLINYVQRFDRMPKTITSSRRRFLFRRKRLNTQNSKSMSPVRRCQCPFVVWHAAAAYASCGFLFYCAQNLFTRRKIRTTPTEPAWSAIDIRHRAPVLCARFVCDFRWCLYALGCESKNNARLSVVRGVERESIEAYSNPIVWNSRWKIPIK